ncbi:MAG TPA: hypothetical protein VKU00_29795 [Chthonomonadaceae bacterium]|nr:hypothetical protein [Chthonomonadaceae bacterium]
MSESASNPETGPAHGFNLPGKVGVACGIALAILPFVLLLTLPFRGLGWCVGLSILFYGCLWWCLPDE